MDLTLSVQQKQIRRIARQFAKAELGPIAKEIDQEGRFPWEAVEKMGPLNFFGMQAPRQYGGADIDSISYGQSFLSAFILEAKNHLFQEITDLYRSQVKTGGGKSEVGFFQPAD